MNGLELYAKIEYLFEFDEVVHFLWKKYIQELKKLGVKTLLDIGCGSGNFLELAQKEGLEVVGIDISKEMINLAKQKGLEVYQIELCDFEKKFQKKFDACVAIFDVVNYLDDDYLKKFFSCVKNVLKKDGYFLFDINTFYGFDEIAQGTLAVQDEKVFGVLTSTFENNQMITKITLFEKSGKCFGKKEGEILQFYHSIKKLKKLSPLKLQKKIELNLYDGEQADKELLIFKQT